MRVAFLSGDFNSFETHRLKIWKERALPRRTVSISLLLPLCRRGHCSGCPYHSPSPSGARRGPRERGYPPAARGSGDAGKAPISRGATGAGQWARSPGAARRPSQPRRSGTGARRVPVRGCAEAAAGRRLCGRVAATGGWGGWVARARRDAARPRPASCLRPQGGGSAGRRLGRPGCLRRALLPGGAWAGAFRRALLWCWSAGRGGLAPPRPALPCLAGGSDRHASAGPDRLPRLWWQCRGEEGSSSQKEAREEELVRFLLLTLFLFAAESGGGVFLHPQKSCFVFQENQKNVLRCKTLLLFLLL